MAATFQVEAAVTLAAYRVVVVEREECPAALVEAKTILEMAAHLEEILAMVAYQATLVPQVVLLVVLAPRVVFLAMATFRVAVVAPLAYVETIQPSQEEEEE